ncbi:amidohydrolase [Pseudorhodobacter turbinis]|uniref:Amidohydrolase n=1 Tax=Pseudorhodobacter turbinis TaxID=2500533 RepID=A0A4P8EGW5_9RHOB|nr:amidohydrolase [Pseudorhodobacter turbinis]QCO56059.1 amidohydrolase [Pseudorhodobacter turbinis]
MQADLIITNARILTMDPAMPRAQAIALGGGHILAVGARRDIEALATAQTRVIDAAGRTVLPGFVESHLHLVLGGAELAHLQVGGLYGLEALRRAFADFGAKNPDAPLLMAQGAGYAMLDHPMTRADLDLVHATRPIAITSADHHTVWANTAALRAAGILHGHECPYGHEVVMGADGLATGELREFEAFAPVIALGGEARLNLGIATGEEPSPWPSEAELAIDRAKVAAGLAHCAAHGITSMVNMDGNRFTLELLDSLRREGRLTARVKVPFHYKPHMDLAALDRAEALTRDYNDDWLQCGFVKMFMDGVIDSRTAYMLQDYPGHAGHRSAPLFPAARFAEVATEIDRRGLQIAVHAIGDGAVRNTIDGYAAAARANGRRDSRHRIEHIELIDPADVPRLGALGIVASLQPPHAPGAMDFAMQPTLDMIGAARWRDAYLCRSLVAQGAAVAFASDWPVTDVSVTRGLEASQTRPVYEGAVDERLGLMESLCAYTAGGAWAAHRDTVTGTLRAGLAADLVMLGGDIEAAPPSEISSLDICLTVCGGIVVHCL